MAPPVTIPWWEPQVGTAERANLLAVLDSNYLNDGDVTAEFEKRLAAAMGCKHAIAVTSGTTALYLALKGLGIGPGDEVVVPDLTFIATANAVTMAGATPVLADVDAKTLTLSVEAFAAAVTPKTRAVMPVHVSGRSADLDGIGKVAAKHGIHVVEDAAEALCSYAHGKALGTIGKAGCFSFSPNKTITTGQGGAIVTNDSELYGRLRALKDQGRPVKGTGGADVHATVGFNFKFTNLQAAVGMGQLELLATRLKRQNEIYRAYQSSLGKLPGLMLPGFGAGETPQWTDAVIDQRDALHDHLRAQGAECRKFWFPLHTQAPYRQKDELFPVSTRVGPKSLWLPSAFTLTDQQVGFVCEQIHQFLDQPKSNREARAS